MLQLLVSIQGLILIEHPYCNEPGQERDGGTEYSVRYNRQAQAGVVDNMVRMALGPLEGTQQVVGEFLRREGEALLQRARIYPNDELAVSRPFPSWNPSILTEIYLCHACS
eukprot:SAG25_NODE_5774_length_622_cov_0.984704_2_plen_111_part_00